MDGNPPRLYAVLTERDEAGAVEVAAAVGDLGVLRLDLVEDHRVTRGAQRGLELPVGVLEASAVVAVDDLARPGGGRLRVGDAPDVREVTRQVRLHRRPGTLHPRAL